MMYELEIKEEASVEILDAYIYYENKQLGLGDRFEEDLEVHLNRVQKYPEHYQIKRNPYREALLEFFPYLIIYEFLENKVIVYSVFNTSRNPKKKPKK
jgi:hypothetical protein